MDGQPFPPLTGPGPLCRHPQRVGTSRGRTTAREEARRIPEPPEPRTHGRPQSPARKATGLRLSTQTCPHRSYRARSEKARGGDPDPKQAQAPA